MALQRSFDDFIVDDFEYGYDERNIKRIKILPNSNEILRDKIFKIKNLFHSYYFNIQELDQTNCIYLTMSIYHNVITNGFNPDNLLSVKSYNIPNSKLALVFKIGSCSTPNTTVYDRLEQELNKTSCIFTIPILVMSNGNSRYVESEILSELVDLKLRILINNDSKICRYNELFSPCDEIKDYILEYCEENDFECIYNKNPKEDEDWFDIIPEQINREIKKIFGRQELYLLETDDNLTDTEYTQIKQCY
jgi:hypothetical protein